MPKVAEQVVPADPLDRSNFGSKEQRTAFPIERRDIFQRAAELDRSALWKCGRYFRFSCAVRF
jgi:hypothetical protein